MMPEFARKLREIKRKLSGVQEGPAYLLRIKSEKGKGTILITSTELKKRIRTKGGIKEIKRPYVLVEYHGGMYAVEIPESFKKAIRGEKDELVKMIGSSKVFPVFHVDKKDPFIKKLKKEGKIETRITKKGLLSVEIKLPDKEFRQLAETPLGKFYANGINALLGIYTHPKKDKGIMKEKDFIDKSSRFKGKSEYEILKRHKTPMLKELIGMLQIIRETKGKALVRLDKLTEEEQKEIEKAFRKYTHKARTPAARKEYMVKTTMILKKRMGPGVITRETSAKRLVESLNKEIENNDELKEHVAKKGIEPFTADEILELIKEGIVTDEKRKSIRKHTSLRNQVDVLMRMLETKEGKIKEISMSEVGEILENLRE